MSSFIRSKLTGALSPLSDSKPGLGSDSGRELAKVYNVVDNIGYLSDVEILYAVQEAKRLHPELQLQFIEVNHHEPPKKVLIEAVTKNLEVARIAEVVSMSLATNQTIVDLIPLFPKSQAAKAKGSTRVLQDVQPGISPEEYAFVEKLCKEYEPLRRAVASRGLNPEHIVADAWCISGPGSDPSERLCWPSLYYRDPATDDLPYARPLDGVSIRISLTKRCVVVFKDDEFDRFPIPGSFDARSHYYPTERQRKDLLPIQILQPQGPSWKISGTRVQWQKWSMQVGFNSKEGCTLHGICYDGRPIMHRMSMCEMVVPYGDPRAPHIWKNAFDAGEDGLGRNANSLVLGCDCLGVIYYFDAFMVTDQGNVRKIKNAVCLHEEDASIAFKHTDWRTEIPMLARNRKLVISFICTIANYEYGFYYHFFLDGNIEVDVKLTGVLSTGALSVEDQLVGHRKYGTNLGGKLYAPVHQHFFVARMDFAIDGVNNSVAEWNCEAETEGDHNPHYNGFYYTATVLKNELGARRHCSADSARFWQILNPNVRNSIGSNVSFKLAPKTSLRPYANLKKATFLKRAQFLEYQLWVTPSRQDERYPGGDFPNQCVTIEGLPKWTQQNRNVDNDDIVVWHTFGVTHMPRPEEWPVMPAEHCGFKLHPFGFFDHSPAMDLPYSMPHCSAKSVLDEPKNQLEKPCCVKDGCSDAPNCHVMSSPNRSRL